MRDETAMRELLIGGMGFRLVEGKQNSELFSNSETEFVARFVNGFVTIGSPPDIARYVEKASSASPGPSSTSSRIRSGPSSNGACVLTYANDTERVRAFVSTVVSAGGGTALWSDTTEHVLRSLPYSATQTNLGEHGIVRVTRSSLGQFSTLLPLVFPARKKTSESSGR
jgi:hypothetical protein